MDAIDDLIEKGLALLEEERVAAHATALEKVHEEIADRTGRIEAVRAVLGLDETTFSKFDPTYRAGWSPNVLLTFDGETIGFAVDRANSGYSVRSNNRPTGHVEYLAREMARILSEHQISTAATLGELACDITPTWTNYYVGAKRAAVWSTPEVTAARVEFLMRVYTSAVFDGYQHQMKNWLEYSAELLEAYPLLADVRSVVDEKYGRWKLRGKLLDCIQRRLDPETGAVLGIDNNWDEDHGVYSDVITLEEVAAYKAGALKAGLADDEQVQAAIAVRVRQMEDANLQAVIEEKRQMLERDLFRPFVYFTVSYGVMADADDEQMVSTEAFDAFHDEPGDDGYWTTVRGKKVRPTFVALIERMEVNTLDDLRLLNWKHVLKRSTEFGVVYVSPQVADVTR